MSDMQLRGIKDVSSDDERIRIIAKLVWEGAKSPRIRQLANHILNAYGVFGSMGDGKSEMQEIYAIFDWVKRNIAYRGDVYGIDSYHTAERIAFDLKGGDCDDMTILLDSLLSSIGWRTGARIVSSRKDKPFHHIYSIVVYPKNSPIEKTKIIPLDPTVKSFSVGDEVPYAKHRDFLFLCCE